MDFEEYLDSAIDIIDDNEDLIVEDYNGKEDQIQLTTELVMKLMTYTKKLPNNIDKKQFIKEVIREAFELDEEDLIISKNNSIIIKYIDEDAHHHVTEEEKGTIADRYNGFDEQELKEFHAEFFEDVENKHFLRMVAEDFCDKYFHGLEITNEVYEINVFGYIHGITLNHLAEMYDNSDGFFHGFAGYVFRQHFKEVFEYIADLVLYEISIGNEYMIEFLNYYSSSVVVLGGQRYQVPTLEADNGMRWNVVSMLSIAKIYTKAQRDIEELQEQLVSLNAKVKKLYIEGVSPVKTHQYVMKQRRAIEQKIVELNARVERYLESQRNRKDEGYRQRVKRDINSIKEKIKEWKSQDEDWASKMVNPKILKAYSSLQHDIDSTVRQLNTKKEIISKNQVAYQSMRNSLVKALTAKKKRIQ